jgi:tRNA A-37 threonylcarbamoyl transferase component Bud32
MSRLKRNTLNRNKLLKESRIKTIKSRTFAKQDILDFKNSKTKSIKVRNWHIIKEYSYITQRSLGFFNNTGSLLFYKDGILYRYLPIKKYKYWLKLYKKGVAVEPIIGKANQKELSEISKILEEVDLRSLENKKIDVNSKDGFVMVKSYPCGVTYSLHETHADRKVLTLDKLISSKLRNQLTNFQKTSIIRQVVDIICKVWDAGMIHGHPHIGNWAIELEKGVPKVKLIDFDMCYSIYEKKSDVGKSLGKDLCLVTNALENFKLEKLNIGLNTFYGKDKIGKILLRKINNTIKNRYRNQNEKINNEISNCFSYIDDYYEYKNNNDINSFFSMFFKNLK